MAGIWAIGRVRNARLENCSDGELMTRLGRGETEVLGELYLRHGDLVAAAVTATSATFSASEVEDLRQDVFMAVRDSASRYRDMGKFRSWLYSVAVRTARDRQRVQRNRNRILRAHSADQVVMGSPRVSPENNALLRLDVARAFGALPEIQRQSLLLFEYLGMSGEEVAEVLNIKCNTLWSHLRRARASLMEMLEPKSFPEGPGRMDR